MKTLQSIVTTLALVFAAGALPACATDGVSEDGLSEETGEALVRPTFDVWQSQADSGRFYFHLQAANGEILLASQSYDTRTAALNGLLSVLDNGGISSRYVVNQGADGLFYVSLRAANNRVIATGEGYATKSNATRAINTIIGNVASYLNHWSNNTGARYQVKEGVSGSFSFALYAANGESVLSSESYTTEAAALNGAFAVAENGVNAARYELRQAQDGRFYFVLKAANYEVIGTSQMYSTKASAERGMASVQALITSGAAELL